MNHGIRTRKAWTCAACGQPQLAGSYAIERRFGRRMQIDGGLCFIDGVERVRETCAKPAHRSVRDYWTDMERVKGDER